MKNRIMLTGATGKIGKYVLNALKIKDAEILPLCHKPRAGYLDLNLDEGPENITKVINEFSPDTIIHLAGRIRGKTGVDYLSNPQMSMVLSEAIKASDHRPHLISLGSASEIGIPESDIVDESVVCKPVSEYGVSKLCQTEIFLAYGRKYHFPVTALRLFNILYLEDEIFMPFGDWLHQLTEQNSEKIKKLRVHDLTIKRDFLPIEIAASYIADFVKISKGAGIVNLGSGKIVALQNIVDIISEFFENNLKIERLPLQNTSIRSVCANTFKLESLLGTKKFDIDLEVLKILNRHIKI